MQAITYSRYGPPHVLELEDVAKPSPKPNEVRVRVRAVEATKADCELRSFKFSVSWFWLPLRLALGVTKPRRRILGSYFAGEVDACGEEVTDFAPGDEVFGCAGLRMGAYAEFVCLPADSPLVRKPANMSFIEAAAVPLGGLNALHFMRKAELQEGTRLLIIGAGGSIGLHAVQIAKSMGAHVTAVDAEHKLKSLRRFGADVVIDYRSEDVTQRGETWDAIFDMVPSTSFQACMRMLASGGRYLCGNPRLSVLLRAPWVKRFSDKTASCAFANEGREELVALRQMIESGAIGSIVDRVVGMGEAVEAHRLVETEARLGAIVIEVA